MKEQREIKFKAFQKNHKRLLQVTDIDFKAGTVTLDYGEDAIPRFNTSALEQVELVQFTGLKDKNGREIYEGDILLTDNKFFLKRKGIVTYNISNAAYTLGEDNVFICNEDNRFSEYEIIGNIYLQQKPE